MTRQRGKKKSAQPRQRTFPGFGQRAKGAGRPKSPDSGVSHLKREAVTRHTPVHAVAKLAEELPSLRSIECYEVIWDAFCAGRERAGRREDGEFRLTEYSIQEDHLHLVVEASDNDALARGMCGLMTRLSKGLNRLWQRGGKVWKKRYHARVLRTPREVYHVLRYVFGNARKHGRRWNPGRPDPFSSAVWFEGWRDYVHGGWIAVAGSVAKARSWLRNVGWRRHGLHSISGP